MVQLDLKGRERGGQSAAFSPDGTRILIGNEDGVATVMDARTGAVTLKLKGRQLSAAQFGVPPDGMVSVSFSPDGTRILTGGGASGQQGEAKVWDAKTGAELVELRGHLDVVLGASFIPDGTNIVTGSADATAKIWTRGRVQPVSTWNCKSTESTAWRSVRTARGLSRARPTARAISKRHFVFIRGTESNRVARAARRSCGTHGPVKRFTS